MFKVLWKLIKWTTITAVVLFVGLVGLAFVLPTKSPEQLKEIAVERCIKTHGSENCQEDGSITDSYKLVLEQQQKQKEEQERIAQERKIEQERKMEEMRIAQEEFNKKEERRKGFHCLSPWNGSHRQTVELIKKNLKDPKSFEHIETRITPVENGNHVVFTKYRAKNSFGGYVVETQPSAISNATCQLLN
jgi:hypothetical protein